MTKNEKLQQLLAEKRYEEARVACQLLLRTNDRNANLWVVMARIHLASGDYSKAIACCQKASAIRPNQLEGVYVAGLAYKAGGDLAAAIGAFTYVAGADECNCAAHAQLAAALAEHGQPRLAIEHYRKALQLNPGDTAVLCNLGHVLHATGEYAMAVSCYQRAIQRDSGLEIIHINMAFSLQALGDYSGALASYRRARKVNPVAISAITGEADILYRTGREQEALELVAPLLNSHSSHIPLITLYAHMARKHGEHQAALAYVDRALEITATGRQDRMQLQFAAGALCDAVEEYENAFLHFEKANQLAVTSYSADQHERSIDRTIQYLSSDTFRRLPRSNYVSEKKPVFVVGMPRSGTSLVEQILASHRQVFAAGELPNIHRLSRALSEKAGNHEAASPDYLSRLAQKQISEEARVYISSLESRAPQACRFVDKTPHNYLYLPLIRLMFPEARIIHCVRHPLDTCLSCYFRLFNGGNDYSYDLNNLGRHYRDYSRLMQHWQQVLRIPMLEIRYEDLVLDQETYSKAIIEYCGLQWEEQCMSFYETRRDVPSASFDQVNKPIYRGSMQRWRHYRGQLTDLRRCLGGIVSAYETTAPS